MENEEYIAITDFCSSYDITSTFVMQLGDYGLIHIVRENDNRYIPAQELPKAEKIVRLYLDLDINLEGIEVIDRLLDRIEGMQQEITALKNRLRLYE